MILCVDVGNSIIDFGVFDEDILKAQFRFNSTSLVSSDQFAIFIKQMLVEHDIDFKAIKDVMVCSVVPEFDYSVRASIIKYFKLTPFFLSVGAKTGLKINYNNQAEIGSDLIATAAAVAELYPDKNLIVVDMGTATTVCAVTDKKEFLGGAILAGMKTSLKALHSNTAKLSLVEINMPENKLGETTKDCIQIGLFYGHLGAVKNVVHFISHHAFSKQDYLIIGTGGVSALYKNEKLFDHVIPGLALIGLNIIYKKTALKNKRC